MRFDRIKIRGLGPYKGDVDIDLAKLPGPLVAVCGPNGAGKSTLLELLAGSVFRQCPTRGTLASLATSRDAYVEAQVVNGKAYTIRHTVDCISKKGESLVLDAAGNPVLDSAKVSAFDSWAAVHFPTPEVFYSSSFAVQGRRGFLDLSPTERKQVLVRVLGLERFERMAEQARERARASKGALDTLRGKLAELPSVDMPTLMLAVALAEKAVAESADRVATARTALDRAKAAQADVERAREIATQRAAVERRVTAARSQLADVDERLSNNRGVVARAAEIRAAVETTEKLQVDLDRERTSLAQKREALSADRAALATAEQLAKQAAVAGGEAERRIALATTRLRDRDAIAKAAAQAKALGVHEADVAALMSASEGEITELQRVLISGKDDRIGFLRVVLSSIASADGGDLQFQAQTAVADDDALATYQADAPAKLAESRAALGRLRSDLDTTRAEKAAAERLSARTDEMRMAASDLEAATAERDRAIEAQAVHAKARSAAVEAVEALKHLVEVVSAAVTGLERAIAELAGTVKLAGPLAVAETKIAEWDIVRVERLATLQEAEAELAGYPAAVAIGPGGVGAEQAELASAESATQAAGASHARALKSQEDGAAVSQRREALGADIDATDGDLSDWTRLGQDLGRDGLQALEIDAAVPELNAIANDLLHNCAGSRFTVTLTTQRAAADGKRMLEGLDVVVLDTEKGRDAQAETYSGGECVIVGEAVALALTTLAMRRAGVEGSTLIRDESGAALDPVNGRAYVAMLRRAARQLGAAHVIYVSHTLELQELADARINIGADGSVTVA